MVDKQQLFSKKNINGVSLDDEKGRAYIYVEKKEDERNLDDKDIVPDYFDGYKTNVIEIGSVSPIEPQETRTRRFDTLQPGISVGHYKYTTAGSLGVFVERDNETFFLTNAHVGAGNNKAEKGDAILQPGPADGGRETDKIGELEHYFKMRDNMKWDASLVRVTNRDCRFKPKGLSVEPSMAVNPKKGEQVTTTGRTKPTISQSHVIDRGVDIQVRFGDDTVEVLKTNMYDNFIQSGDSGSIIAKNNGQVLADLAFAGSDKYSFGIGNIEGLLEYYNVKLPSEGVN